MGGVSIKYFFLVFVQKEALAALDSLCNDLGPVATLVRTCWEGHGMGVHRVCGVHVLLIIIDALAL